MSADVLLICVPTFYGRSRCYPSVNELGKDSYRGGRKSPEYRALFAAVKKEAEAQMALTGWEMANYHVEVHFKRYFVTLRAGDPSNYAKCEVDALEAAGVVTNDKLVRLFADGQYDPTPGAIDRIVMVVLRLYPPAILAAARKKSTEAPSPAFVEAQAIARQRTANRPAQPSKARSFDQLKSGDKLSWDELEMLKKKVGLS